MTKACAGLVLAVVLVLGSVGCGGSKTPAPVLRPFVATGALESGRSGVGDGASTPTGEQLRCWNSRRFAQNVTVRNRSKVPVTLTGAALDSSSASIIRRVAVQFRLAPPPPTGDAAVIGLRAWSRSAARPTTIPPGRKAWVQSNFELNNCDLLPPVHALITNRAITVTYQANGHDGTQRIAMTGARIILTGKPAVPAAVEPAIKHHDRQLQEGDVVPLPRGPTGGHQIRNETDRTVRVLIVSSNANPDVAEYPDTDKIGILTDAGDWQFHRKGDATEHAGAE